MTDVAQDAEGPPNKSSKLPMILGVVLALAGGAGGFAAVKSGALGGGAEEHAGKADSHAEELDPLDLSVSFVPLDPLIISLADSSGRAHLRFVAQLEVPPNYVAEVESVKPRIIDMMNGYLRAVEIAELEDPTALMRLRGQILRRVQVVTGEGRVNDLLIMEFVVS